MFSTLFRSGSTRRRLTALAAAMLISGTPSLHAEGLRDAIEESVLRNPEVLAKWHVFQAAGEEARAAEGGYYPTVDLEAYVGFENKSSPNVEDRSYDHPGVNLQLKQMLFDGFATRSEVRRLNRARLARYYDVLAISNDIALETTRAYVDVLRQRELEKLARENYAAHREIYELLQQKVAAGVGRRVDLEQASGRLALAESNWLTETGNLHDVSARFERLVGRQPGATLDPVPTALSTPAEDGQALMERATKQNPTYLASIADIYAAKSELDVRKSTRWPTIALKLYENLEQNQDGIDGQYENNGVQLALNYNIYRGGSDRARERESQKRILTAQDLRIKACRDLRQSVRISWAEVNRLREQVTYLAKHESSTAKARDAYRLQFEIGQRSLLDMLDTENELFQSRRALANARMDQQTAEARLTASIAEILPALDLNPVEKSAPPAEWDKDDYQCPVEVTEPLKLDRDAAMAGRKPVRYVPPAPPAPAPAPVKPAEPVDTDRDGVTDDKDACPDTKPGVLVDSRGCPITQNVRNQIELNAKGLFATGQAKLLDTRPLEELAQKLSGISSVDMILITGHTDQTGKADKNIALSLARANSVKGYLVEKGIFEGRIRTEGRGATEPLVPIEQCTAEVKQRLKNGKTRLVKKTMTGKALSDCLQPNRRIVVQVIGANTSQEEIIRK